MFFILFGIIYILIGLVTLMMLGTLLGYLTEHSKYQKLFIEGRVPKDLPSGFYKGEAFFLFGLGTPWLGKAFSPADMTGFNLFSQIGMRVLKLITPLYNRFSRNENGMFSAFMFKVRIDKSLREKKDVIVLDYSAKENPFLIRIIVDEVVEVSNEEYLGKIHLKLFPGFLVTIGFFGLKKSALFKCGFFDVFYLLFISFFKRTSPNGSSPLEIFRLVLNSIQKFLSR